VTSQLEMTATDEVARQPVTVLAVRGEIDYANFGQLTDRARALYGSGSRNLVLDLSGVTYLGSSGLVALHGIAMIFRGEEPPDPEEGWSAIHAMGEDDTSGTDPNVKLLSPSPQANRVLERTGMRELFEVFDDRATAVESF
jgi:anti-anti-sigma regulatory factor